MGRPLRLNPDQNPIAVPNATSTSDGGMSSEDKVKLDGLASGAVEVNLSAPYTNSANNTLTTIFSTSINVAAGDKLFIAVNGALTITGDPSTPGPREADLLLFIDGVQCAQQRIFPPIIDISIAEGIVVSQAINLVSISRLVTGLSVGARTIALQGAWSGPAGTAISIAAASGIFSSFAMQILKIPG